MGKLLSASVLFTFVFLECFSQKDFRNGYVIMNNNDTIFGLINYGSNYGNTLKCLFKVNIQSAGTVYYPDNIIAYRFENGRYFISKSINPSDTTKIFLEFLFDGIVNLYDYYFGGRDQLSYLCGLECSYNLKSKNSIFLQLRYEYDEGTRHKGHWSDSFYLAGENDYNGFDMNIPRIVLLIGCVF